MTRLHYLLAVAIVVIGHAKSEDKSVKTRLQENITGYRSRYSPTRGQMQPKVLKPQNIKIKERDAHDSAGRKVVEPVTMMAVNQQNLVENLLKTDVKGIEERDEDRSFNCNNIKVPPVLMMALNQQDEESNDKITNQRAADWSFNWNNIKNPPILMMALNQQDEGSNDKITNQRAADRSFNWNNIKNPPVLMMALNQQDEGSNDKITNQRAADRSFNWNNIKVPPVLMMALNQQDEGRNDQKTNQRDVDDQSNIDFSKFQAILMMALNQQDEANGLLEEDYQEKEERDVDTNDYKTIMMSVKESPQKKTGGNTDVKEGDATTKSLSFLLSWLGQVRALRTEVSKNEELYFNDWVKYMNSLRKCSNKGLVGRNQALAAMGLSDFFLDIFWPFRYDVNVMNQRLAVSGFEIQEHLDEDGQTTKTNFIKGVENMLEIHLPVKENEVILSFDDEEVVDELLRTGILNISKSFKSAGKHIFQGNDRQRILNTANAALKLINETSPDLYKSIVQMVSVIAFYRAETSHFTGGTGPSLIGIIWLNPVNLQEWTVHFMAEQIVHEFTHNSLFCAELVHGFYKTGADMSKAQLISAIRHEQRDFDRCLHAAYVSASLITFHTRIGQFNRARQLAETLTDAVHDLNAVNANTDVLNASGRGILQFLNDYMCLMRL